MLTGPGWYFIVMHSAGNRLSELLHGYVEVIGLDIGRPVEQMPASGKCVVKARVYKRVIGPFFIGSLVTANARYNVDDLDQTVIIDTHKQNFTKIS